MPLLNLPITGCVARAISKGACVGLASLLFAAPVVRAQVPYVPTPQNVVDRMLEIAKVGPGDYLIDLGSGDGRIVVTAAKKYGTRGYGVDLNPTRIDEANENARQAGVTDKVAFYQRNLFETDLSQATVITMYLLPRVNLELRPKLLELKPGTRLVSHDFSMGDWTPEQHEKLEAKDKYGGSGGQSDIYLWIVPAQVAGMWRSELQLRGKPMQYEFRLDQEFQNVGGTASVGGRTAKLQNVQLRADRIAFDFNIDLGSGPVRHHFEGQVNEGNMIGVADLSGPRIQARQDWSASRTNRAAAADAGQRTAVSTH